jgi:hypothetical protein
MSGVVIVLCGVVWNLFDVWDTATFALEKLTRVLPLAHSLMSLAKPYWIFYVVGIAMVVWRYSIKDPAGEILRNRRKLENQEPARFVTVVSPTVHIDGNAGHVDVKMMVANGTTVDLTLQEVLPDKRMGFLLVDDASAPTTIAAPLHPVTDFTIAGGALIRSGEVSTLTIRQHLPPALLALLREGLDAARVLVILLRWSDFVFVGEEFRFRMSVPDIVYQATRAATFTDRRQ